MFNICSSKNNALEKTEIQQYLEVCRAVYQGQPFPDTRALRQAENLDYWHQLHKKLVCIHTEIQEKSKSINKSFGIFNEDTLRHAAPGGNIAHDVEGYKGLIARPYESVKRAMPGSYYSDIERTVYLTYYILMEDVAKYNDLFQHERKFINFEYFNNHLAAAPNSTSTNHIDYDDLVYGNISLSELVVR